MRKISHEAITILKNTLSTVFWFKKTLAEYFRLSLNDGSFSLDNTEYIIAAKWHTPPKLIKKEKETCFSNR